MNVTMKVDRLELISKLEAAREEALERALGRQDGRLAEKDDKTIAKFTDEWVAAERAFLAKVESGEVKLVPYGGGSIGPGMNAGPARPQASRKVHEAMVRRNSRLRNSQRAEAIAKPYDVALDLLRMSKDAEVGIDGADYHALLEGRPVPLRATTIAEAELQQMMERRGKRAWKQ